MGPSALVEPLRLFHLVAAIDTGPRVVRLRRTPARSRSLRWVFRRMLRAMRRASRNQDRHNSLKIVGGESCWLLVDADADNADQSRI